MAGASSTSNLINFSSLNLNPCNFSTYESVLKLNNRISYSGFKSNIGLKLSFSKALRPVQLNFRAKSSLYTTDIPNFFFRSYSNNQLLKGLYTRRYPSCISVLKSRDFFHSISHNAFKRKSNTKNRFKTKFSTKAILSNSSLEMSNENNLFVLKDRFLVYNNKQVEGNLEVHISCLRGQDRLCLTFYASTFKNLLLHWGMTPRGSSSRNHWQCPPSSIWPPETVRFSDNAAQTPFMCTKMRQENQNEKWSCFLEIEIGKDEIPQLIYFVLQDVDTQIWYKNQGKDFEIEIPDDIFLQLESAEKLNSGNLLTGLLSSFSLLWKGSDSYNNNLAFSNGYSSDFQNKPSKDKNNYKFPFYFNSSDKGLPKQKKDYLRKQTFVVIKEDEIVNEIKVQLKCTDDADVMEVRICADIPGVLILHWGITDANFPNLWKIPPESFYPKNSVIYKDKALQSIMKKDNEMNNYLILKLPKETHGIRFVLKEYGKEMWYRNNDSDFVFDFEESRLMIEPNGQNSFSNQSKDSSKQKSITEKDEIESKSSTSKFGNFALSPSVPLSPNLLPNSLDLSKSNEPKTHDSQNSTLSSYNSDNDLQILHSMQSGGLHVSSGTGSGREILLHCFNWESHKSGKFYEEVKEKVNEISQLGFSVVWLPPPTESVSPEGYLPLDLYNLNSRYGSVEELRKLVRSFHDRGIAVLGDVVLNHRCAHFRNSDGIWNVFGGKLNWDSRAIVCDDPCFKGTGNHSTGDNFHAAPNIDHSQNFVRKDIIEWLRWMRTYVGYDGWRLDFVRGFCGSYVKEYVENSDPYFAVGELWDSLSYTHGILDYDQDKHRQRIVDWINAAGGYCGAFDITTKGILHAAIERVEYWRLADASRKPPGVLGFWPSRAVTFIENHDTGSTQGHWRFPRGRECEGYAYILTHPGTPCVFFDHVFPPNCEKDPAEAEAAVIIAQLIRLRTRNSIHCRSKVEIYRADHLYVACIDSRVLLKMGPGHYVPDPQDPNNAQQWVTSVQGNHFQVWELVAVANC